MSKIFNFRYASLMLGLRSENNGTSYAFKAFKEAQEVNMDW